MKYLNYVLQILFIRITWCQHYKVATAEKKTWYALQGFIVPFTGWGKKPFRYVGKKWFLKISKFKYQ